MDPGFVFAPPDHKLTDDYLAGEIAGRPVVSTFIHHADVYSALPDDLVLGSGRQRVRDRDGNDACYIISPVRSAGKKNKLRSIDGDPRKSYWHSEAGKIPLEGSKTGGYVQDFVHAIKLTGRRVQRLGWRMKEYGLSTEHGDSDVVLCKIYLTPRKPSTASTSTSSASSAMSSEDAHVHSDPAIGFNKRKAAEGDYPEDSCPSARRRLTDQHPPAPMADPEPEPEVNDDLFKMKKIGAAQEHPVQPEPESFFQSMEQEFPSLYPNHNSNAVTEEATPPWAPAADQPEDDAATGLLKTLTDDQMDGSLSKEGAHPEPEPYEPAPDVVICGLPCPAFSPEMIWRCSDNVMTPWLSPSSMRSICDLY